MRLAGTGLEGLETQTGSEMTGKSKSAKTEDIRLLSRDLAVLRDFIIGVG